MTDVRTLRLPEELTIYTASDLRTEWLGWLADQREDALIDSSAVATVDAAGLQLLVALVRGLEARQLGWRWQGLGSVLCDACRTLGLADWLGTEPGTVACA